MRSVQVCAVTNVKVLRDWGILSVNSNSTLDDVFYGICTGQLDSSDGFYLKEQGLATIKAGRAVALPFFWQWLKTGTIKYSFQQQYWLRA